LDGDLWLGLTFGGMKTQLPMVVADGNGDGAAVPKQETMATVEPGSATGTMEDEE